MQMNRQTLTVLLRTFAEQAILNNDAKWGLQLARVTYEVSCQLTKAFPDGPTPKTTKNHAWEDTVLKAARDNGTFKIVQEYFKLFPEASVSECQADLAKAGEKVLRTVIRIANEPQNYRRHYQNERLNN